MARPASVTTATVLVWVLVGIGVAASVAAVSLRQELAGPPLVLPDGTQPRASYAPVVVVMCIVVACLFLVLVEFVRGGHGWARVTLAALLAVSCVGVVGLLVTAPPTTLLVIGVTALVVQVAIIGLLVHPTTSAFLADPVGYAQR